MSVRDTLKALAIGGLLWFIISAWRRYLQRRLRRPRDLSLKYGPWAVVTGATGGMGLHFVDQLAEQGLNIVISARGEEELKRIAEGVTQKYGVRVHIVVADLSTDEGQERLVAGVQDLDVGLLVHNAGLGYVGAFADQNAKRLNALVQLNVVAPMTVTSALLPALRRRKRSGVIFVSSLAAYQPLPLHTVYAASKSFVSSFGVGLWEELKRDNVDVLVSEPGSVATSFAQNSGTQEGRGVSPAKVVRDTLAALGYAGPSISPGSLFAWLRSCIASMLPRTWSAPLGKWRQKRLMKPAPRVAN